MEEPLLGYVSSILADKRVQFVWLRLNAQFPFHHCCTDVGHPSHFSANISKQYLTLFPVIADHEIKHAPHGGGAK